MRATVHGNDELFGKLYDTLSGAKRDGGAPEAQAASPKPQASEPSGPEQVDPKVAKMVETLLQNFPVQKRTRSAAEEEK